MVKEIILYGGILVGLVVAQALMDVPSSNGDLWVFARHSLGICLAFFAGAFWMVNK